MGHIYLPREASETELAQCAAALVEKAGIPLVLFKSTNRTLQAIRKSASYRLPADRAEVLGAGHPFLDEVADDLVALCKHPDSGDLIISRWDPECEPLSFPMENGAHCGPGFEETHGFLLLPDRIRRWHLSRLPETLTRVRGEDLRKIALHFLGRDGPREERVRTDIRREEGIPLRVMTYNIHSCRGLDGKVRPERVARVINHFDPDIVAVQEVDSHRPRSREVDQADVIAQHLRMSHVFHAMFEEEKERYGIAIFSRHPFRHIKSGFLTQADPRRLREARGAIWLEIQPDNGPPFQFINTHFGIGRRERRLQVETLLGEEWIGKIQASQPLLLCGDFNSRGNSPVVGRIRERLRDVQNAVSGHKPLATFSSILPLLRIDHIFVSGHFSVGRVQRPGSPTAKIASDHLPLCVELTLS